MPLRGSLAAFPAPWGIPEISSQTVLKTARTPEFQTWVDRWLAEGLVYQWSTGWSDGSLMTAPSDGHPRYAVHGGMNSLAKHLAQDLDVRTAVHLEAAAPVAHGWEAVDDRGRVFKSQALLLTPPVPQSLALLDAGGTELSVPDRQALEHIEYVPSLAGLFWLDRPAALPEPGAVQRTNAPITWIADNRRKGISPEATLITVHASPQISQVYWDAPDDTVLAAHYEGLLPFLVPGTRVLTQQLKRWRYALPSVLCDQRTLLADGAIRAPLAFAGDAFGGPRVEGAALSGLAAGRALAARLTASAPDTP